MDWIQMDNKLALYLLIVMARLKTPAKLTIGQIFDLSINTFLKVSVYNTKIIILKKADYNYQWPMFCTFYSFVKSLTRRTTCCVRQQVTRGI